MEKLELPSGTSYTEDCLCQKLNQIIDQQEKIKEAIRYLAHVVGGTVLIDNDKGGHTQISRQDKIDQILK